jgi:hypothetical protein
MQRVDDACAELDTFFSANDDGAGPAGPLGPSDPISYPNKLWADIRWPDSMRAERTPSPPLSERSPLIDPSAVGQSNPSNRTPVTTVTIVAPAAVVATAPLKCVQAGASRSLRRCRIYCVLGLLAFLLVVGTVVGVFSGRKSNTANGCTYSGDVSIKTMADIVHFSTRLRGFCGVKGNVDIYNSPINSDQIEAIFGCVQNITGGLRIESNYELTNLDGLRNLTSVGGDLYIGYNTALKTLEGLRGLIIVGGGLAIGSNTALTTLEGLRGLTMDMGGYLYIYSNYALTDLEGLDRLRRVGGDLDISNNGALTNLDALRNLTSVGGDLSLNTVTGLTTLEGLGGLTSVGGNLVIYSNFDLTTLEGLHGLTSVGGCLVIQYNSALTTIEGLRNLRVVRGGTFYNSPYGPMFFFYLISDNKQLVAGLPLPALTCVGAGTQTCDKQDTPACSAGVVPAGISMPCGNISNSVF